MTIASAPAVHTRLGRPESASMIDTDRGRLRRKFHALLTQIDDPGADISDDEAKALIADGTALLKVSGL